MLCEMAEFHLVQLFVDYKRMRIFLFLVISHRCCCIPANGIRHVQNHDFEPVPTQAFDDKYEQELSSVEDVRGL